MQNSILSLYNILYFDIKKKSIMRKKGINIIYVIHGCYEQYRLLLEKIRFSDNDKLYVLGDAVDRGPEPIKVLQDMMRRR